MASSQVVWRSLSARLSVVAKKVFIILPLDFCYKVVHHSGIEVFTAKMTVSSGRLYRELSVLDGEDRDVESTSAKIENENSPLDSALLKYSLSKG